MADDVRISAGSDVDRRRAIGRIVGEQPVRGPKELRRLLADDGFEVTPQTVRDDLVALGARRVGSGDDAVIALPDERGGAVPAITDDPDWPLQLVVVAVVALFVLVGLIGWLAGGSGSGSGPAPTAPVTTSLIH